MATFGDEEWNLYSRDGWLCIRNTKTTFA